MRELLNASSIERQEAIQISEMKNWMTPYLRYLANEILPEGAEEARQIKRTANWYTIVDGLLYCRGYTTPYLRCLTPKEADCILSEVHFGICESHVDGKNLAFKIMRKDYYWPSMKMDALEFVKRCKNCQLHDILRHQPSTELKSLQAPWLFEQWGLDIIGPFFIATRLKTKLEDAGGSWVDELASVLWSYRTTPKEPTREIPFSLYYGTKEVIPVEI
ncbi:hypothetical protein Nepgr_025884 [Nepenthes gracilis]|uniref:Integrase zinc-binding domain-containing protein n=1 Tax=Nepenthes gracilis TaxID=150966 RepID=A0AAD3T7K6_NEPGR|nr:hypothetical protein Nepgr_025884 [Nepenthes gracilis]